MKKISLSIPFLILVFAISLLAGCDSSKDPKWEASKKALVEEFLASAQGITHGDITVDSTKKSVTIANLKVQKNIVDDEGQNLILVTAEADKLVASNVNFVDAPSGVIDIAEKAQFSNIRLSIAVAPSFLQLIDVPIMDADVINKTSTIQQIDFEKIRDDASLFLKTVAEQSIPLSKVFPQREKFRVASVSLKKIASETKLNDFLAYTDFFRDKQDPKVLYTTEEVRAKDISIEGLHDYLLMNSVGELDGKKVFSIESSAIKSINLPSLATTTDFHDLKKLLSQDLSVEGMVDKNIRVFLPMGEVLVKATESNFIKKGNQLVFNSACKNFIIPSDVLDYLSQKSEAGKFSELYNKPLDFSTKIDLKGTLEDDRAAKLAVSSLELSEANLGKINLGFTLEDKDFDFPPKDSFPRSLQLDKGKLLFEDKGIIDLGFAFAATLQNRIPLGEAKESGKAMRTLIAGLYPGMCVGSIGTENKNLCDEVAKIVKAPGSLEILLEPTDPLLFKSINSRVLRNLKETGVTAKYTK